jgi:hypothetical protein
MTMDSAHHDDEPGPRDRALAARTRQFLREIDPAALPVTYRSLAKSLALAPPNTIHQLTNALEVLMREDTAAGVPMIAALVVSRWRGGLPAPGFFELATRLGHHDGAETGPGAQAYFEREFAAAMAHWVAAGRALD